MNEQRDRTLGRILNLRRLEGKTLRGNMILAAARHEAAQVAEQDATSRFEGLQVVGPCPTPALLFTQLDEFATARAQLAAATADALARAQLSQEAALTNAASCEALETFLRERQAERRRAAKWR